MEKSRKYHQGNAKDEEGNRGSKAHHHNLEKALIKWIQDTRRDCLGVNTTIVRLQALRLAKEQSITEFKKSMNWCRRFFGRNNLSIRRRTTISQRLPSDHEELLMKFQIYVIKMRQKYDYDMSQIGNGRLAENSMDETQRWSGETAIDVGVRSLPMPYNRQC